MEGKQPELTDNAVQRYNSDASGAIAIHSLDDIRRISTIFIGSGMFKGNKSLSQNQQLYQAGVKIIAGMEFGIQPFAAMRGINIINGNAEMSANLMAAKVKKHPKYDYRVTQWDNDGCTIEFYEIPAPGAPRTEWDLLGPSSFTMDDARQAGLAGGENWRKFSRNMFFARAISNGVRVYCPDVFYGAPVYVEGEISGEPAVEQPQVPDDGEVANADQNESAPETDRDEPAEAEIVDNTPSEPEQDFPETAADTEDIPADDDAPQAAEEPDDTPAAEEDDSNIVLMGAAVRGFSEINLDTKHTRQLIRQVTGKPFLKNCNTDDLNKLLATIEAIRTGEQVLPADWFNAPEAA